MTKLITSDPDRYLEICNRLDDAQKYLQIIEEMHVSRSVIPQVKKHRIAHPEYIKELRAKVLEKAKIKQKAAREFLDDAMFSEFKNKESTNLVPISTKIVPISTNLVPRSTINPSMLLDEFEQLETYFRKDRRPSQEKAIAMFKKHLGDL